MSKWSVASTSTRAASYCALLRPKYWAPASVARHRSNPADPISRHQMARPTGHLGFGEGPRLYHERRGYVQPARRRSSRGVEPDASRRGWAPPATRECRPRPCEEGLRLDKRPTLNLLDKEHLPIRRQRPHVLRHERL